MVPPPAVDEVHQPAIQTHEEHHTLNSHDRLSSHSVGVGSVGDPESSESLQMGVKKLQLMQAQWSTKSLALVYLSIVLLASLTSLEGQVNYLFIPYVTSDFSAHALLSTIQIISAVLQTILKAPAAKVADVFGRVEALTLGVVFYVLGYICMACSTSIWWYAASQIFYIGGTTGTQFLTQLIVADTSSLVNRALVSSIPFVPFLWTVWAGPPLGEALLNDLGWRWGLGIWAFIIPVAAAPLIVLMYLQQRKIQHFIDKEEAMLERDQRDGDGDRDGDRDGDGDVSHIAHKEGSMTGMTANIVRDDTRVDESIGGDEKDSIPPPSPPAVAERVWWQSLIHYAGQMDIIGTLIASAGLALLLVPLTLASRSPDRWASVGVILPMCIGAVMFTFFVWFELKIAKTPLVSLRLMRNSSVFFACFAGFFYYFSYYVGRLYFPSYLQVAAHVSPAQAGHINNAMNFTSTGIGIVAGLAIKYTKAIRPYILAGSIIYIVGLGMLVFFRTPDTAVWAMVLAQIVLGFGGGMFATPNTVFVQSHATAQDLGAATALVLVITTLGWSTGAAVAGAIWTNTLPNELTNRLPEEFKPMASDIAADINVAMQFPAGSEARHAIDQAYYHVMRLLCIVGVGLGVGQLICVLSCRRSKQMDEVKNKKKDDNDETTSITADQV